MEFTLQTLREKCPYSELFWSDHNKIQTRITPNQDTFYAVKDSVVYPTDLKMKETRFKEFYRAPGANDFQLISQSLPFCKQRIISRKNKFLGLDITKI